MRKGFYPKLVFSNAGNLVAIATGSDACTEHEIGIKPLLREMTRATIDEESMVKKLRGVFRSIVTYPDLQESRRITRLPSTYQFVEVHKDGEEPQAWLGVSNRDITTWSHSELEFPTPVSFTERDINVAAAYSDVDFGIRVRGDKYVKALREFHEALQAGDVLFGGLFFDRPGMRLEGMLLVNRRYLSDADRAAIAKAQREFESSLRLKARDDTTQLRNQMMAIAGDSPGYLWVRWADASESSVVYCLNPGYGIDADYFGPYTREQLLDWAQAKYKYPLRAQRQAA